MFEDWRVLISFRPFLAVYWFKFWTSCPVTFEVVAITVQSVFVVVVLHPRSSAFLWLRDTPESMRFMKDLWGSVVLVLCWPLCHLVDLLSF